MVLIGAPQRNGRRGQYGGKQGILVVAATNRLKAIDAALLRPGRLEEHVHLLLPEALDVRQILELHTAKMLLGDFFFEELSKILVSSEVSGADIEGICRDACLIAMRRCSAREENSGGLDRLFVTYSDFHEAIRRIKLG